MEHEFSISKAIESARQNRTEEFIHAYLTSGEWANLGLSNGLKQAPRFWRGPLEIPISKLFRKCGPEPEMEYQMPQADWEYRTRKIAESVRDPLHLPPLIAQYVEGRLIVCDGSHRHEAARLKGWTSLWTFVWFDREDEFRSIKSY